MELQLRGITKRFPGVLANDRIDLTVRSGEILGLLGENGAGKTTLMNILYGLYSADEGEILIDGEEQHFTGPGDAIAAGIGMVHQHFMLVPVFTVAENVVLGVEPTRRMPAWLAPALGGIFAAIAVGSSFETTNWFGWPAWAWTLIAAAGGAALGFLGRMVWPFLTRSRGKARRGGSINCKQARDQVSEISERYSLHVDPDAIIEDLPVGVQQRVEIIKVLFREAHFLIFDEPTAVLTPQEVQEFFGIVRSLRDAGKGIVFITHKLGEVLQIADTITVLRDGRSVGEAIPGEVDQSRLAEMMVGRPVELVVAKEEAQPARRCSRWRTSSSSMSGSMRRSTACPSRCAPGRSWASPACRATARPNWCGPSPGCGLRCRGPSRSPARTWPGPAPGRSTSSAWPTSPRTACVTAW